MCRSTISKDSVSLCYFLRFLPVLTKATLSEEGAEGSNLDDKREEGSHTGDAGPEGKKATTKPGPGELGDDDDDDPSLQGTQFAGCSSGEVRRDCCCCVWGQGEKRALTLTTATTTFLLFFPYVVVVLLLFFSSFYFSCFFFSELLWALGRSVVPRRERKLQKNGSLLQSVRQRRVSFVYLDLKLWLLQFVLKRDSGYKRLGVGVPLKSQRLGV